MLTVLAAVAIHAYSTTAQGVALGAMYTEAKNPAVVKRINAVGTFATVLTAGGRIEGQPATEAILVERFSFGWQALVLLNSQCELAALRLGRSAEDALMLGMPQPEDDRPCKGPEFLEETPGRATTLRL